MTLNRITLALLIVVCSAWTPRSFAVTTAWTNAAGGSWHESTNWDNGVPDSFLTADISLAGTYTVTISEPAYCAALGLGGDSGNQTLEVLDSLLIAFGAGDYADILYSFAVDSSGVLDVYDKFAVFVDTTVLPTCHSAGVIELRNGSAMDGIWDELGNRGTMRMYGNASIVSGYSESQLLNQGDLAVIGGTGAYVGRIDNFTYNDGVDSFFASFTVDGALTAGQIINEGAGGWATMDVASGAVISMSNETNSFWGGYGRLVNLAGGLLRIRAGAEIKREYPLSNLPNLEAMLYGSGSVEFVPDTTQTQQLVRVESYRTADGYTLLDSTNLKIYDWGRIADSVHIAAICTLFAAETTFDSADALIRGDGNLIFTDDSSAVRQQFPFAGRVMLDWTDSAATVVEFNPPGNSMANFNWLGLLDSNTVFQISNTDTVRVDTVAQFGGTISGATIVNEICDWRAGTLTADTTAEFLILPGAALTLTTGSAKTLDSIALTIEGSATLLDSGALTLQDSAVVNVAPGGTLGVLSGFEMNGIGTLYNSGQSSFDPQGDTIRIDVPLINSTVARTPGTIDVLSSPVVLGSYGWNGAGFNLAAMSTLILNAQFRNASGGTMSVSGGRLVVNDTLWNEQFGQIDLTNGGEVSGAGVVMNGGDMSSSGGLLLTPTNNIISGSLVNLADTGFVNLIGDTLTVSGNVTNQDTITIQAGAVLKVLGIFLNDVSGVINGNGTLDVSEAISFINNGTISPGLSPGALNVNGELILGPTSRLLLELRGPLPAEHDVLTVSGSIQLGGTLALSLQNGYIPQESDDLQVLNCGSWSGEFASIAGTYMDNGQFLSLSFGAGGMSVSTTAGLNLVAKKVPGLLSLQLSWQPVDGAISYTIYVSNSATGPFGIQQAVAAPDTSVSFILSPLRTERYYYVTVNLP